MSPKKPFNGKTRFTASRGALSQWMVVYLLLDPFGLRSVLCGFDM